MKNFKTTEKLIIVFAVFVAIILVWTFSTTNHSDRYVCINCPKCGSERVMMTHRDDVTEVEHLLCMDCLLEMTMTDAVDDSINSLKRNGDDDCEPVIDASEESKEKAAEEETSDSLYNPELECPY